MEKFNYLTNRGLPLLFISDLILNMDRNALGLHLIVIIFFITFNLQHHYPKEPLKRVAS